MPALREHIVEASERYSRTFKHKGLSSPPSRHFIFVTCMDSRIDTSEAFGIAVGEAHVIRNVSCKSSGEPHVSGTRPRTKKIDFPQERQ